MYINDFPNCPICNREPSSFYWASSKSKFCDCGFVHYFLVMGSKSLEYYLDRDFNLVSARRVGQYVVSYITDKKETSFWIKNTSSHPESQIYSSIINLPGLYQLPAAIDVISRLASLKAFS